MSIYEFDSQELGPSLYPRSCFEVIATPSCVPGEEYYYFPHDCPDEDEKPPAPAPTPTHTLCCGIEPVKLADQPPHSPPQVRFVAPVPSCEAEVAVVVGLLVIGLVGALVVWCATR